jgi:FKBP-type peptidyl-prolyl cis-trans isomerase
MRRTAQTWWLLLPILVLAGCGDPVQKALQTDKLYIQDIVDGSGEPVKDGDFVAVNYVASLYAEGKKGPEFDRSRDKPKVFQVGRGGVIQGWDKGMLGMREGGKRTLVVAPELGYGTTAIPGVPAGSTLTFEIELVSVPRTQVRDLAAGNGNEAEPGDYVKIDYTGWIYENGARTRQFDSSTEHGEPVVFAIGSGMVIKGWDQGVTGMRVGGRRELIIPPEMGYGDRGTPTVPGGSTLLFELALLEVPRVQPRTLIEGSGEPAMIGDILSVHYTGWLQDAMGQRGEQFDSSRERAQPFQLKLGTGKVIPGWELGLRGMKVGERRELIIPPDLGYGSRGIRRGVKQMIPAGSTLIFEIDLVSIIRQDGSANPPQGS